MRCPTHTVDVEHVHGKGAGRGGGGGRAARSVAYLRRHDPMKCRRDDAKKRSTKCGSSFDERPRWRGGAPGWWSAAGAGRDAIARSNRKKWGHNCVTKRIRGMEGGRVRVRVIGIRRRTILVEN